MERSDDDIQEYINEIWPELGFTVVDLRKPSGERYRQVLMYFMELFYTKVTLPKINFGAYTRNPEMFAHNDVTLSLYREVNNFLRSLGYSNFRFTDIINPAPMAMREVLSLLVNLATFMETNTDTCDEVKNLAQSIASRQKEGEKRLAEEKKHLSKCKQVAEERKMHEMELNTLVTSKKEALRQIMREVEKVEEEANSALKHKSVVQQKLDQAIIIYNQADGERKKASDEVVLDPEGLQSELDSLRREKEILYDEYNSYKERLPTLELQLREKVEKLEKNKELVNRLAQVKARENKVKLEMNEEESLLRKQEKEVQDLETDLYREQCTVESKKRMLEQNHQDMTTERNQAEEERLKLRMAISDESKRKQNHELNIQKLEKQRCSMQEQLELSRKSLDEFKIVSMEIDNQFQLKMEALEKCELELFHQTEVTIQETLKSFQN